MLSLFLPHTHSPCIILHGEKLKDSEKIWPLAFGLTLWKYGPPDYDQSPS